MPRYSFWLLFFASLYCSWGWAQENAISSYPTANAPHRATPAVDLRIKKIFVISGNDDVGNVLAPELDRALVKKLESDSRFEVIKNDKVARALKLSGKGYDRVIANPEIHARAARLAGADTTVVMDSRHVGNELRIRQDWHKSDGSMLFAETYSVNSKSPIAEQRKTVAYLTDSIINRIPFRGSVTGRTGNSITLDMNENLINVGDRVSIGKIVSTKEHPLLKTLINIDYVYQGSAEITSTDNVLSFAKILNEENGEQINTDSKVVKIDSVGGTGHGGTPKKDKIRGADRGGSRDSDEWKANTPDTGGKYEDEDHWKDIDKYEKNSADPLDAMDDEKLSGDFEIKKARYGGLGARALIGSISHNETLSSTSTDISGWGVGASVFGEAWVTKNWVLGLSYDFLTADMSGTQGGSDITEKGSSWNKLDIYGGYRYLPDDTPESTYITFALGYESVHMDIPVDLTNRLGKKSYSGLLLLVDGSILLDPQSRVHLGLGIQPFSSLGETEYTSGDPDGATVVNALAAWEYRAKDQFWLTLGLDYSVSSGSIANGKSLTEKKFSISPGLKYLF